MMGKLPGYLRVMIVDDEPTMRSLIRTLLRQADVTEVTEAEHGEEALTKLRELGRDRGPHVIICDLHMRKMDGMDFINVLRKGKEQALHKNTPVVILTGNRDTMMHDVLLQSGATAILVKPMSAIELIASIESAVRQATGLDP